MEIGRNLDLFTSLELRPCYYPRTLNLTECPNAWCFLSLGGTLQQELKHPRTFTSKNRMTEEIFSGEDIDKVVQPLVRLPRHMYDMLWNTSGAVPIDARQITAPASKMHSRAFQIWSIHDTIRCRQTCSRDGVTMQKPTAQAFFLRRQTLQD